MQHEIGPRGTFDSMDPIVVVRDPDGIQWQVGEMPAATVPGAKGATCLVFISETIVRRTWHVPPGWSSLPPDELLALASLPLSVSTPSSAMDRAG